jgi:hypothetical protein
LCAELTDHHRCFGYAQGVMGGLLTVPAFLDRFPQVDTINNDSYYNAKVQGTLPYPPLKTSRVEYTTNVLTDACKQAR